jgi:cysteine-S-conjugate beta-lyase
MAYDFDTPIDRRRSDSAKWGKYADRDIIPMWVADMDFRSPPEVIEAIKHRADHGVFGYARHPKELDEAVVALCEDHYHWQIDPDSLVWFPGVMTGVSAVCRTVGAPGDDVLTTTPAYPPFLRTPGEADRMLITAPLALADDRWEIDFDALTAAVTERTRVFMLANPHNPVGRLYTRDELERLAEFCLRRDIVIASDEIHCQLVLDEQRCHTPTATLGPEVAARTVTIMAPSKTFNLPALGCSFAIISDKELRTRFRQTMRGLVHGVNVLGIVAALAAYRLGEPWRQALLAYLRGNCDLVEEFVADTPPLAMTHVEATYLAWIDVRGLELDDVTAFFETAGVGLENGRRYGLNGYVRLNFGCPRATLREALRRIASAVARCGK